MKPPNGKRVALLLSGLLAGTVLASGIYWYTARPAGPAVIDYRDAKSVALGKQIYDVHCASCHGAGLEGQENWRERRADGRLPAPPHDESGHTWHHADQQLFDLTKFGPAAIVGGGYVSDMPGFADKLTDEEILAVLAFIKSSWPPHIRERHDDINRRAGN